MTELRRAPWAAVVAASLGLAATACGGVRSAKLFINEIYANGPGDDWVELYNASPDTVALDVYRLYDTPLKRYSFPKGATLPARGFTVVRCSKGSSGGGADFQLSSQGETVHLEDSLGRLIDRVTYPTMVDGTSYGRFPDGSGKQVVFSHPTEGAPNGPRPRRGHHPRSRSRRKPSQSRCACWLRRRARRATRIWSISASLGRSKLAKKATMSASRIQLTLTRCAIRSRARMASWALRWGRKPCEQGKTSSS